jgi:hypothetical protein
MQGSGGFPQHPMGFYLMTIDLWCDAPLNTDKFAGFVVDWMS